MKQLISLLILTFVFTHLNAQYHGKITKVYDGETFWIKLDNGELDSVRLWGIDAPELDQKYGVAAKENLETHIHRKVDLKYKTRDKNNYMIAIVTYTTKNGEEVNLNYALIEQGCAWKNRFTEDKKLEKLQRQAQKNKVGLWKNMNPMSPWEWRKKPYK